MKTHKPSLLALLLLVASTWCSPAPAAPSPSALAPRTSHHLDKRQVIDIGPWTVDTSEVFDFFASPKWQRAFFITLSGRLLLSIVGLFTGHFVWQSIRGEEKVTSDPDLSGMVDFVLNDDIAAMNVGIDIGYMVFGNLAYKALALLGDPSGRRRAQDRGSVLFDKLKAAPGGNEATTETWLESLDFVFGLDFIVVKSLVYIINTVAFLGFWWSMQFLPKADDGGRRRKRGAKSLPMYDGLGPDGMSDPWLAQLLARRSERYM